MTLRAPIRVLCVDDNPRLTEAWGQLFQQQPDMEVVGAIDRADHLVDTAIKLHAHIILTDLTMDGIDPLDAVRELARRRPEIRALVYSGHNDTRSAERALDAGAWGFIAKHEDPERILDAVRRVAAGEIVLPPSLVVQVPARPGRPISAASPPRSDPEPTR